MQDGTVYEEIWNEGECVKRVLVEVSDQKRKETAKAKVQKLKPVKLQRADSLNKELELNAYTSLKAVKYVNQKLLKKNSIIFFECCWAI
jgi:hypothetical protein